MKFLKVLVGMVGLKCLFGMIFFVMVFVFGFVVVLVGVQQVNSKVQEIVNYFFSIKMMMGDFVQFGLCGDQIGGKFYIVCFGKVWFNYDVFLFMCVILDGCMFVVGNMKFGIWDQYLFFKMLLVLLFDDKIDLIGKMVCSVKQDLDFVIIVFGDKLVFGDLMIIMMFDFVINDLCQWMIMDVQGKEILVMIYNVKVGVDFVVSVFVLFYDQMKLMVQGK